MNAAIHDGRTWRILIRSAVCKVLRLSDEHA
jgi:hypothetical protein